MAFRTILLHLGGTRHAPAHMKVAVDLARREAAHLIGLATPGLLPPPFDDDPLATTYRHLAARRRIEARDRCEAFEHSARSAGLDSFETRTPEDLPSAALALHARYADLLIVGQPDPTEPQGDATLPDAVLEAAPCPILMLPTVDEERTVGDDVLIAWDGTRSAARAVSGALPMLEAAKRVRGVLLSRAGSITRNDPADGAALARFLSCHGIGVEVLQDETALEAGEALVSRASDYGADLLVMGAYGHSRSRELLWGGTTRTVLETATVPVLFAHA